MLNEYSNTNQNFHSEKISACNDQEHHTHFLWTKNTCTSYPGVTESYETDEDITTM